VTVSDREPVELGQLERYALGDTLLALRLGDEPPPESEPLLRAAGVLPVGTPGTLEHRDARAGVEAIAARVLRLREGGRRPGQAVSLELPGGLVLHGDVGDRWDKGLLLHQYARVSGRHVLELWVRHLALCLDGATSSYLVGRGREGNEPLCYRLRPAADAAARLAELVGWYRRGLERPLALFPKAGFEYARKVAAGASPEQALKQAQQVFSDEIKYDAHLARVFGDERVVADPAFAATSLAVMGPLVAHLEEQP
jgi:exodeoxyribonuclease V gamma subunit